MINFQFDQDIRATGQVHSDELRPGFALLTINQAKQEAIVSALLFKRALMKGNLAADENIELKTKTLTLD